MRTVMRISLAAALMSGGISCAAAQETGEPKLTRQQCATAHAEAYEGAVSCIKNEIENEWSRRLDELKHDLQACYATWHPCSYDPNRGCFDEEVGFGCGIVKLIVEDPSEQATAKRLFFENRLQDVLNACMSGFAAKEASIKNSCPVLGDQNGDLHCQGEKNLVSLCNNTWRDRSVRCKMTNIAACLSPRHAMRIDLAKVGCGGIRPKVESCLANCASAADQTACRKDCTDYGNALMAACLPWTTPQKSASDPGSRLNRDAGLSASRTKNLTNASRSKAKQTSAVSAGVKGSDSVGKQQGRSNRLDRHDLGPSFVSPDATPSSPKAVRRAGGAGSNTRTWAPGVPAGGTTTWAPAGAKQ